MAGQSLLAAFPPAPGPQRHECITGLRWLSPLLRGSRQVHL